MYIRKLYDIIAYTIAELHHRFNYRAFAPANQAGIVCAVLRRIMLCMRSYTAFLFSRRRGIKQ